MDGVGGEYRPAGPSSMMRPAYISDAIGQVANDGEIVRDEEQRDTATLLKPDEQAQDCGLHGDVERRTGSSHTISEASPASRAMATLLLPS